MRAVSAAIVVGLFFASAACGAPPANGAAPASALDSTCGITPEERAAPVASDANYVPPAPNASAASSSAPRTP